MNENIKELIAIGASISAHCQPCLEYHIRAALKLGVNEDDIRQAVEVGHLVEKGAMSAMNKFSAAALKELSEDASENAKAGTQVKLTFDDGTNHTVLKIYDPAMCCSSGVCGPGVDPDLARFAGTLNFISTQPGVRVERYNLGQQPRAFVENAKVKALLADGGEKRLPFIFINDQLWSQERYPAKDELLQALKIKSGAVLFLDPAASENNPCCGDGGCC